MSTATRQFPKPAPKNGLNIFFRTYFHLPKPNATVHLISEAPFFPAAIPSQQFSFSSSSSSSSSTDQPQQTTTPIPTTTTTTTSSSSSSSLSSSSLPPPLSLPLIKVHENLWEGELIVEDANASLPVPSSKHHYQAAYRYVARENDTGQILAPYESYDSYDGAGGGQEAGATSTIPGPQKQKHVSDPSRVRSLVITNRDRQYRLKIVDDYNEFVQITVYRKLQFRDRMYLLGDIPEFSRWNIRDPVPMDWYYGHIWRTDVLQINAEALDSTFQCKITNIHDDDSIEQRKWKWQQAPLLNAWQDLDVKVVTNDHLYAEAAYYKALADNPFNTGPDPVALEVDQLSQQLQQQMEINDKLKYRSRQSLVDLVSPQSEEELLSPNLSLREIHQPQPSDQDKLIIKEIEEINKLIEQEQLKEKSLAGEFETVVTDCNKFKLTCTCGATELIE